MPMGLVDLEINDMHLEANMPHLLDKGLLLRQSDAKKGFGSQWRLPCRLVRVRRYDNLMPTGLLDLKRGF